MKKMSLLSGDGPGDWNTHQRASQEMKVILPCEHQCLLNERLNNFCTVSVY